MNIRIRYKSIKVPHIRTSTRNFTSLTSGGVYRVDLYYDTMTYRITNINKQVVVKSSDLDGVEKPTHIVTLRRQAKKALKSLGVGFDPEVRFYKKDLENEIPGE